ncbi:porin, partial [Roseibacterium sp. SDUM158017]|uniref:porin n=1 Tax=Roseicyclus salinarum TaxID=3036773 RepID=UPI00241555BF
FATTALVATAGVAMADVAISGYAEMGIAGGSDNAANDTAGVTQFFQDIDVTFTMSGTSDNGLTFGASVDIDETAAGTNSFDDNGTTVFISGDFGTLTMGDTDGAFDWALTEANIGSPGSIDDSETLHAGYSGNSGLDGTYDGQVLRYDYSMAGFGAALSVEMDDTVDGGDPAYGLGAKYSGDIAGGSYGIGIGYQTVNDTDGATVGDQGTDVIGFSASVSLDSGLSAALNYSQIDGTGTDADEDGVHMAIGASYTFDAITVHANYGSYDWDDAATTPDSSGYGLAAAYDLGGGLSAHLGYGYSDNDGIDDESSWSLGLAMSF